MDWVNLQFFVNGAWIDGGTCRRKDLAKEVSKAFDFPVRVA